MPLLTSTDRSQLVSSCKEWLWAWHHEAEVQSVGMFTFQFDSELHAKNEGLSAFSVHRNSQEGWFQHGWLLLVLLLSSDMKTQAYKSQKTNGHS